MDDILIERNVLRGVASGYCSGGCNGLLGGGIVFDGAYNDSGATAFPTGVTIDNNIVEYQQERISGATSCSMSPDFGAMAIGYRPLVATTGGVITNNTLYYDSHPLMVCGSAATVTDNLIVRVANPGNGSVGPVTFDSGAAASTIANNDVYNASGVLLTVNGTDYTCTSPSTWSSSDPGTNDLCALPAFAACDSATYCASVVASPLSWDLHLAGNQACVGAGASCSTLDIDQQTRPSPCDIGADQWFFPQLANPTYPPYPNPPSVSKAQ
jgi:hypothetical protein